VLLAAMGSACGGDGGDDQVSTNQTPAASFTYSCSDLDCSFDGTGSSDTDGSIVSYAWTFGDGATGSGATISHVYDSPGTRIVTLTVTDNGSAIDTQSSSVTVAANQVPTASFTYTCSDLSCGFDGTASSDTDGDVVTYAWDFGDGETGSGATTIHAYGSAGTRTVTLTVTDDDGATGSRSQAVTVSEPTGGDVGLLPVYHYELTTSLFEDPIVVEVPMGENLLLELGCVYGDPNVLGEYEVETGDYTIAVGSHFTVSEVNEPVQLFGMFEVRVTELFTVPAGSRPTSGGLAVFDYQVPSSPPVRVDLLVLPAGAGVRMTWDSGNDGSLEGEVELTWAAFDELLGSEEPEWQQLGSFAYAILLDFMPELGQLGMAGLEEILATRDVLPTASPVTVACDAYSAAGLSVPPPPPVIPDQGSETFTWYDDAASGDVNSGDSFSLGFDYCLAYSETEDSEMFNGRVDMNSWTEVVTNNVLTRIGFEETSPAGKPGGLVFEDFELWEVWDADGDSPGTAASAHLGARVNGRVTIVLTEPTN